MTGGHGRNDSLSGSISGGGYRDNNMQREKEKATVKEDAELETMETPFTPGMVTAPTSPLVDGPANAAAGSVFISTPVLDQVSETLEAQSEKEHEMH